MLITPALPDVAAPEPIEIEPLEPELVVPELNTQYAAHALRTSIRSLIVIAPLVVAMP